MTELYDRLSPGRKSTKTQLIPDMITQEILPRLTEGKNQALVGVIRISGEYPGPRFEDKFRSTNQMDGISNADGDKMAAS